MSVSVNKFHYAILVNFFSFTSVSKSLKILVVRFSSIGDIVLTTPVIRVLKKQLTNVLEKKFNKNNLIIAYEPIWSIGTGKIPNSSEIKEMHKHIKQVIYSKFNNSIKVIYGGSVNPSNVSDILNVSEVDGVLIGGASLNPKDFLAIYSSTVKHLNLSFSNN